MALILLMETSTEVCSVGLSDGGKIIGIKELFEPNSHASQLHVLVNEIIKESNKRLSDLDAIAVSKGPGSYTGLRVGVSSAKGYCIGLGKPLIAINTLESLSIQVIENHKTHSKYLVIPMLDARRMEVYCQIWNEQYQEISATEAKILDENSFLDLLESNACIFTGTGMQKFQAICSHPNAHFQPEIYASVKGMAQKAEQYFQDSNFEDSAYFEPYYLKDFVATSPKKTILPSNS